MSAPGIRKFTDVNSDGTAEITLWTIDANQITPGADTQVITTTSGTVGWAAASGGGGGSGTATALSGTGIVTSTHILDGTILNADVNASAAIAYSKLALTGSIVSGDITDGTIVGGDLSSTIAIPAAATATTQSADDNSTKVATTAYVDTVKALKANLASPTFTGSPVLPTGTTGSTQTAADNSTKLATTAYVDGAKGIGAERHFVIGVAGGLSGVSGVQAADFYFPVPYNSTIKRMKAVCRTAPTAAMTVQLRKSTNAGTSFADISGFIVTYTTGGEFVQNVDPADANISEDDLLSVTLGGTQGGADLMCTLVIVPR